MNSPILAATINTEKDIPSFPLLATPKVDGVRALMVKGQLVSRTIKPIPNRRIRAILESLLPDGADGEIYCGDLYTTTSTAMSFDADGNFKFFWFDWAYDVDTPYSKRVSSIETYIEVNEVDNRHIIPLIPHVVRDLEELYNYEKQVLNQGFEGIMLRIPDGKYKSGRSTLKEGLLVKLKRSADSEATIIGTEELIHRAGLQTCKAGDTLGAIIARGTDGTEFRIGTGYTADQRLALWANRDIIVGRIVKYKHSEKGTKNKPRCAVFIGTRHEDDM
jgi:DNA ligase-1